MAITSSQAKPMRADARRNRERVLEAARACFGRDGMTAQIDDVAACAGVGVGTVYRHFATKEALIEALAALEREDPWEGFSGFIRCGAQLMAENRALAQISADRPEVMQQAAVTADAEFGFFATVEAVIDRAQRAGTLREDFELEDVPGIMCSLGALQISPKGYANWQRVLELVLEGCRTPSAGELPPVVTRVPRQRGAAGRATDLASGPGSPS